MPLLSIIIPVFNVEKYLKKCLDSILIQDFKDYECILIDDGSKDSSGIICDQYAKNDKRIKVISQENQGLSGARNTGVLNSSAPYITFLAVDDVEPLFLVQYNLRYTLLLPCSGTILLYREGFKFTFTYISGIIFFI